MDARVIGEPGRQFGGGFALRTHTKIESLQTFISPDTVINMHDQVARIEAARFGDEVCGLALSTRRGEAVAGAYAALCSGAYYSGEAQARRVIKTLG